MSPHDRGRSVQGQQETPLRNRPFIPTQEPRRPGPVDRESGTQRRENTWLDSKAGPEEVLHSSSELTMNGSNLHGCSYEYQTRIFAPMRLVVG
jgi:hypothetical protein